jgi:hypothetical protein
MWPGADDSQSLMVVRETTHATFYWPWDDEFTLVYQELLDFEI